MQKILRLLVVILFLFSIAPAAHADLFSFGKKDKKMKEVKEEPKAKEQPKKVIKKRQSVNQDDAKPLVYDREPLVTVTEGSDQDEAILNPNQIDRGPEKIERIATNPNQEIQKINESRQTVSSIPQIPRNPNAAIPRRPESPNVVNAVPRNPNKRE